MERNSNKLLLAMLGGIITCFLCVGMVFAFTSSGNKNLKGNEVLPNQGEVNNIEEEIALGDAGTCSKITSGPPGCAGCSCSGTDASSCSCNASGVNCCIWTAATAAPTTAPTTAPTATPAPTYSCYDKNNSCYLSSNLTSNCNGTRYFTRQSDCYQALSNSSTPTPTPEPTTTYSCYDKNSNCSYSTGLTSNCNGTRYFTKQSDCYQALSSTTGCCYQYDNTWKFSFSMATNECARHSGSMITQSACSAKNNTPPPTTYSCYDKNNSCYLSSNLTSDCNGTRYFTKQSDCYQALSNSSTPTCSETSAYWQSQKDSCLQSSKKYWNWSSCKCLDQKTCYVNKSGTSCEATLVKSQTCDEKSGYYEKLDECKKTIQCSITGCTKYSSTTASNCTCKECANGKGVSPSSDGKSCVSDSDCLDKCKSKGGSQSDCEDTCNSFKSDYSHCKISVQNVSGYQHMSPKDPAEKVKWTITGADCPTGVRISLDGFSGPSSTTSGTITSFSITKTDCSKGTITGCINGTSICAKAISIQGPGEWSSGTTIKNISKTAATPTSKSAADVAGKDVYYSDCTGLKNNVYESCVKHTRGCGTTPPTVKTSYCYTDSDGNYHWTNNPSSGWKKVSTITKEANCKKTEDPACYKDTDGNYQWGKYASKTGYTLISAAKEEKDCNAGACYKNSNGDYKWSTSAPSGYTKVDTINKSEECAPPESPACYLYGNNYKWGKYEKVNGYIKIENITKESDCKVPETEACYLYKDGKYVWGKYAEDDEYTLVPSVTEMKQCNNDVPTPKTDISVTKIVYVFMAVLMACGIGFIYYSSVLKKED